MEIEQDSFLTALSAVDELQASDLTGVRTQTKPIIDMELAELGNAMKIAMAIKKQADRAVRLLEGEQERRLAELRAAGSRMEKQDARTAWIVTNPAPRPTVQQVQVLALFERCLGGSDAELLAECYTLCLIVNAQFTSWRTGTGEALDVAYARRRKELATNGTDTDVSAADSETA